MIMEQQISAIRCIRSVYHSGSAGFSLMQITLALLVLSLLLIVVLPVFFNMVDEARDTRLKAVNIGLHSAVLRAREKWLVSGRPSTLETYGGLRMSEKGWPLPVDSNRRYSTITAEGCRRFWRNLLIDAAPQVLALSIASDRTIAGDATDVTKERINEALSASADNGSAEFYANAEQGRCRYYMSHEGQQNLNDTIRLIEYDPNNGRVIWRIL